MREFPKNPGDFAAISLATLAFSASSATNDTITTSTNTFKTGDEIVLHITNGNAGGLTDYQVCFVILVNATTIKLATTLDNAEQYTCIDITANIGAGTIYPCYDMGGGALYVGTTGHINAVGCEMPEEASPVLIQNIAAGIVQPPRYRKIFSYLTTATNLVRML